jgi:hypothetical protein
MHERLTRLMNLLLYVGEEMHFRIPLTQHLTRAVILAQTLFRRASFPGTPHEAEHIATVCQFHWRAVCPNIGITTPFETLDHSNPY